LDNFGIMKNNVDSSLILNRKIVIELRFTPVPRFLDLKGTLIEKINLLKIIGTSFWGIGDSAIKVSDSNDDNLERTRIHVEINRLSLISTRIDSIESYFSSFQKIHKVVEETLGDLDINRIGCRIQGTYKTKSKDFANILSNFKNSFPEQVLISDFPVKDMRFQLNYQNGQYHIGPVQENDQFLIMQFPYPERNNNVGVAVDTDNFLLKTKNEELNQISKIKDVFTASLAVEKSLVSNLSNF
jgi:hypothetical protein